MSFLKKLNISKWLWIAGAFYLILFAIALRLLNQPDIFWGVFVASLLSFLTSFFVEKWLEEKEGAKAKEQEREDQQRTIELMMQEIIQNSMIAETISKYIQGLSGLSDQDFRGRNQDCFFCRFSMVSKNALWKQYVEGVCDNKIIEDTSMVYAQYEYLNNMLSAVCGFITGKLTMGSIAADYKRAVTAQPWDLQLPNGLVRARDQGREIASLLKTYLDGVKSL